MRAWREAEHSNHFYYSIQNGQIQGHVFKIGSGYTIYNAKVYKIENSRMIGDIVLGTYIELEYAKKAVESWWDSEDKIYIENRIV